MKFERNIFLLIMLLSWELFVIRIRKFCLVELLFAVAKFMADVIFGNTTQSDKKQEFWAASPTIISYWDEARYEANDIYNWKNNKICFDMLK